MSFRFHVHRANPVYRLVIAEGASFPQADTAPDVAKLVDETGFCLG